MLLAEARTTHQFQPVETTRQLLRALLVLAFPVMLEQLLHMCVGLTDTYIANHVFPISADMLPAQRLAANDENVHAAAAVNTVGYLLWFVGLLAGAVGTGSTAIIARATGARHRRLANSICGQSIGLAACVGAVCCLGAWWFAGPITSLTGLQGRSIEMADIYMQRLAFATPFMIVLFVANACLRGAGDTVTPAVAMITVDATNVVLCLALTRGWFGLPAMGFVGIAYGTTAAYTLGGLLQLIVLVRGRGGIRLHLHRLRPHWHNMRRLLRIGIPSGIEGSLLWLVNFVLIRIINQMDSTQVSAAAHGAAVRIEAVSYLGGFALATAAATMVGQSLGMNDPRRAKRSAYLAYAVGGSLMTLMGIGYILFGGVFARWMSDDPAVAALVARCLFITGFVQSAFASAMIFGGSLRGAGDTTSVMVINLVSLILLRLVAVSLLIKFTGVDLPTIWVMLCIDLACRGTAMFGWFARGRWRMIGV